MTYDVIIVGGGPAGLTASIYCARAGLNTLVIEKETLGGKITETPKVVNIPGFVEISGAEFGEKLTAQAEECGANIVYAEVTDAFTAENNRIKVIADGDEIETSALIIATGTENRNFGWANISSELDVTSGRHYCVTCDGPFYKNKSVIVVGGGNSGVTEALELADIAKDVTVLQNLPSLTAEQRLVDALCARENVAVHYNCNCVGYEKNEDGSFKGIIVLQNDEMKTFYADGIFLALGLTPQNKPFANLVDCNEIGYITSAKTECGHIIEACGDCVSESKQQVAVACGAGANAALNVIRKLKKL